MTKMHSLFLVILISVFSPFAFAHSGHQSSVGWGHFLTEWDHLAAIALSLVGVALFRFAWGKAIGRDQRTFRFAGAALSVLGLGYLLVVA